MCDGVTAHWDRGLWINRVRWFQAWFYLSLLICFHLVRHRFRQSFRRTKTKNFSSHAHSGKFYFSPTRSTSTRSACAFHVRFSSLRTNANLLTIFRADFATRFARTTRAQPREIERMTWERDNFTSVASRRLDRYHGGLRAHSKWGAFSHNSYKVMLQKRCTARATAHYRYTKHLKTTRAR